MWEKKRKEQHNICHNMRRGVKTQGRRPTQTMTKDSMQFLVGKLILARVRATQPKLEGLSDQISLNK